MRIIAVFWCTFFALYIPFVWWGAEVLEEKIEAAPDDWVRMANVRRLPIDIRSAVVRDYARRLPEYSEVMILGDSQTFGVDLVPSHTLGAYLRESQGPNVFNMSIVDGRYSDQLNVISILKSERKRFKYLILNINPAHFKRGLENPHHLPNARGHSLTYSSVTTSSPGVFAPYSKIPYTNIPLIRNEDSSVYEIDLYGQKFQPEADFSLGRQPKNYYSDLDLSALGDLLTSIKAAGEIADNVIAFAAPTSYAIYNEPKYDWKWDTSGVIKKAIQACQLLERTVCVDLSSEMVIPPKKKRT